MEFIFDFTNAPPSTGPQAQHVPPGTYKIKIDKIEVGKTKDGEKTMVTAAFSVVGGDSAGKKLLDRFLLPHNAEASKVGIQRWHSVLVAAGMKEQTGKLKLDTDKLHGRTIIADVDDDDRPESEDGKYKARTVSKIVSYTKLDAPGDAKKVEAPKAVTAPAPEPVQAEMEDQGEIASDDLPPDAVTEKDVAESLEDLFA